MNASITAMRLNLIIICMLIAGRSYGEPISLEIDAKYVVVDGKEAIVFYTKNSGTRELSLYRADVAGATWYSTKVSGLASTPMGIELQRTPLVSDGESGLLQLGPGQQLRRYVYLEYEFTDFDKLEGKKGVTIVFSWIWDNPSSRKLGLEAKVGTVVIRK